MLTLLPLLAAAVACAASSSATPDAAPDAAPQPQALLQQIHELIGTPACTASSECKSLAVGAKACGGPDYYLPWSNVHTAPAELADAAERYRQARRAQVIARHEMSTCNITADPGAYCKAGQCVLRRPSLSGPADAT
ncbi:hypothetical protein [Rugamonas sp.]|uniref:hypothetical protein n=1 Tax=Rugamonas sp. TaxID=1926287 RepID=UPI0025E33258|nr:hypothetical protein [Rugamonas sp.]